MDLLQQIRKLYSLETLDTRFTASKSSSSKDLGPGRQVARSPDGALAGNITTRNEARTSGASVSLWATTEFYVYYVVFLLAIPLMFKVANEVSNRKSNVKEHLQSENHSLI